jgi:ubiquinone/menaquinone biosynthesis C-methylase UbiE
MTGGAEIYEDNGTYSEKRYMAPGGVKVLERQNGDFERLLDELGAQEGDSVLELGSGPALLSEHLSDEYEVYAADVQRNPLMEAEHEDRVEQAFQVDAHRLPFQEECFEYVLMPRLMHLSFVDEPDVLEEVERVAEKGYGFDTFSPSSGRIFYNPVMHLIDEDMPESDLHTEYQLDGWPEAVEELTEYDEWAEENLGESSRAWPSESLLEDHEETVAFSDFFLPFGLYREVESEQRAEHIERFQDAASDFFDVNDWIDLNTVNYRGINLSEE